MANPNDTEIVVTPEVNIDDFITSISSETEEGQALLAEMDAETKAASTYTNLYHKWEATVPQYHFRLVPPAKAWGTPVFPQRRHWVTSADGKRIPLPCIAHQGYDCIGCALANDMGNIPGNGGELQEQTKTQVGFLYNVIDTKKPEDGIKVFSATKTAHDAIQAALKEGHNLYGIFDGVPIVVKKTVSNGNTRYSAVPGAKAYPIAIEVLSSAPNLLELCNPPVDLPKLTARCAEVRQRLGLAPANPGGKPAGALPAMNRAAMSARPAAGNRLKGDM